MIARTMPAFPLIPVVVATRLDDRGHNRRGTPMAGFQTLLGLGLARDPITYREIIDQAA